MLTIEDIRNQKKDLTPFTDNQVEFLTRVLNHIVFPWTELNIDGVLITRCVGPFGEPSFSLDIDGLCYMTNQAVDLLDHRQILEDFHGDVLLTGYGLGIGVLFCNLNNNVKTVTVLENNPAVIKYITPMVDSVCTRLKPKVIETDANTWVVDRRYDYAFIDHAYKRADDARYQNNCDKVVNWYDERMLLEKSWL